MLRLALVVAPALLACTTLTSCGGGGGGSSAPSTSQPTFKATPPGFIDATAVSGIAYEIGYRIEPPRDHLFRFATSGVAAGDYDNDGDLDLLVVRGDIGPNLLYRNNGAGIFVDVAAAAGLAFTATATASYRQTGPAFADMDGDGDLDVFIGGLYGDPSLLFRNNGDGRFTNVTAGSGIDTMHAEQSISTSFGDYDLDGDLDMFVSHWGTVRDMAAPGDTEHLWRNDTTDGAIRFTSVSELAGIAPSILTLSDPDVILRNHGYTFTSSFVRINADLYPDIVSVADHDQTMVFMNNGDGTFDNVTDVSVITDSFGMGSALGDYDDDGDIDWFVTSIMRNSNSAIPDLVMDGNRLYRNDNGVFVDATASAGVADGDYGWGACFADLDNDGDLDIYHTNGWNGEFIADPSRAFISDGRGSFSNGAASLGLADTEEGRGVVCADLDGDGDIDILQQHRDSRVAATLWRNDQSGNNYLSIRLKGTAPNTEAAGARIYATIGDRTQMREIIIGNTFLAQNPAWQTFGLGKASQVDKLRIEWPDGTETERLGVTGGQTLVVNQSL